MSKFKGVLKGIQDTKKDIFDLIETIEKAAPNSDGKQILDILDTFKEKVASNIASRAIHVFKIRVQWNSWHENPGVKKGDQPAQKDQWHCSFQ